MKINEIKTAIALLFVLLLSSCNKDEFTIGADADDFFHLINNEAILPVWVQGNTASGIYLIHVHGGPGGESMGAFNVLASGFTDPLEQKYANVYYDQRYSGSSQGKYDKKYLTEEQYAEDLFKLIQLLKHKYGNGIQVFLMGSSWGGRLCSRYLLNQKYQSEVAGWISVSGAQDINLTANAGKRMLEYYAQLFLESGKHKNKWKEIYSWASNTDTITDYKGWDQQNEYGYEAMEMADDSLHHEIKIDLGGILHFALFSPSNAGAVLLQSASFNDDQLVRYSDLGKELSAIQVPSLIMGGKFDFVVPPEVALSAYNNIGTSKKHLIIFEYSGHNIPLNEKNLFVEEVINFIERYR